MHDKMMQLLSTSGGFSRANNYRVELTLPSKLSAYNEKLAGIQLSCSAAAIPGITIGTTSAGNGTTAKPLMVSDVIQQTIDLNFYMSTSYIERTLFEDWRKLQIDDVTRTIAYYDDYVGEVNIYPMRRGKKTTGDEGNTLLGSRLVQAFPITIGQMQYSYDADGEIVVLPVQFAFFRNDII